MKKTLPPPFTFSKILACSSDRTVASSIIVSAGSISSPQEVATFNGPGSADMGWFGSWVGSSVDGQRAEENKAVRKGIPRYT